jgi:hypothetical protein
MSLGVLGLHLCPIRKAGGQDPENQSQTVTALAKAIGIDRSWLSNAISNAQFYAGHYEDLPPQATIGQLNRGRKLTGWTVKLEKPPTKTQIKKAMKYLEDEVDEPPRIAPTAISYVRAARAKLVKVLEHEEPLPPKEKTIVESAKDGLDEVDSHYETEDE